MPELPTVEAEITFRPPSEGGRHQVPDGIFTGCTYRPHIVIGDPAQKHAIATDDNRLTETYLGVAFSDGPEHVEHGRPYHFRLTLMYWPAVEYSTVVAGATFTLREGGSIVGHGCILTAPQAGSTIKT
jgi:hypothetical protein